jgi:LPXTG-site transpeptidase (sortase) family protein
MPKTTFSDNPNNSSFSNDASPHDREAVEFIRDKVERLYAQESSAKDEVVRIKPELTSKHQKFISRLLNSDKDLATIQTEWHEYYQHLPDAEKHKVWQEFYASRPRLSALSEQAMPIKEPPPRATTKRRSQPRQKNGPKLRDVRSVQDIKHTIRHNVTAGGKLGAKQQLQSLLFGLGVGTIVIIIFMFGFFNEVVIAPFIQPSRAQADTPLIIGNSTVAPTSVPEVIIPKINVEIPVDYSETSTNESVIESDLEDGVVHYPTTVLPGQDGNAAYFGHSSNNIFNPGKYKFAFVLLHTLVDGDTFYLTYNDKVYIYKVISHTVVNPSDVSVLGPVSGQTATATLITCDPPGTSINRLIVVGQQISPNPNTNTAAATTSATDSSLPGQLPGNGPTLWTRFIDTLWGKLLTTAVILLAALWLLRSLNRYAKEMLKNSA